MLRIYLFTTILITVECANSTKVLANVTAWLTFPSNRTPMIILQSGQTIPSAVECNMNGKKYKEDQKWFIGHLQYKCLKFGAYTIIGCRTRKGRSMNIGETYIDDFVAHQCFQDGSKVYYRESPCDLDGEPSCSSFLRNSSAISITLIDQTNGYPAVAGLPRGWKIVNSRGETIPLNRVQAQKKTKRQTGNRIPITKIRPDSNIKRKRSMVPGTGTSSEILN
uniref:S-protein homolog n=1 Tax=Setaria digitata TaxID=48799 RepID=A0A915Q6R3_9BILA